VARVNSEERARYVAETCGTDGWHYIIGFEFDKAEDISDLAKALNPPQPLISQKVGRNDPCPCVGSNTRSAAGQRKLRVAMP
jgi:hypothetical protein